MAINFEGRTVEEFARIFLRGPRESARNVIDKTGIAGKYVFHLEYGLDDDFFKNLPPGMPIPPSDAPVGASIFTAVQEQLGLKLDSGRGPGRFLVVDSVERPSPN